MLLSTFFSFMSLILVLATATQLDTAAIFKNPVVARIYQGKQYTLKGKDAWENNNVSIKEVAKSLAALKPTYVNSVLKLGTKPELSREIIDNYRYIRQVVRQKSPGAVFDVELSLDPNNGPKGYASGAAAVAHMKQLNAQLPIDGWWFDYLSTAQHSKPHWVVAVTDYAHKQNQTIGGNVFHTGKVPPNVDAVAFDDGTKDPNTTEFGGYGIKSQTVEDLVKDAKGTLILGHLNCNPQNNRDTTESCVYMRNWTSTTRAEYLHYWLSEQQKLNFTYMLPLFFPLCPGASSYSPLKDVITGTKYAVYDRIKYAAKRR